MAADAELRRRYPDQHIEPLGVTPADPEPSPTGLRPEPAAAEPGLPAWPDLGPHAERIDHVAAQLREISERLDDAAIRKAREASERAAQITSMQIEMDDPDAAPVAAWKSELEARQRDAVRHEPMPRVPHAQAIEAQAARIPEREAAD